ncbi:MAG: hypothetical protein IH795_08785, partial [Bacteroidetes bacterium]|nr:hypothetical protein [Bacteroidota bacterium]
MAHKFFEEKRPHNGMTYEESKNKSVEEIENIEVMLEQEKKSIIYNDVNFPFETFMN